MKSENASVAGVTGINMQCSQQYDINKCVLISTNCSS